MGIHDDVSQTSLAWDAHFETSADRTLHAAVFYGLGSDGTVSANQNTISILGEETAYYAQGHFVFDSKKSGAVTVSHLRFGDTPIRSTYAIGDNQAEFIACHQSTFLENYDLLDKARPGATFLLNAPWPVDRVWDRLPRHIQAYIISKQLKVYVIDAYRVAREAGLGPRINTIMQTCYFALSGLLPEARRRPAHQGHGAAHAISSRVARSCEANEKAIDQALSHLQALPVPGQVTATHERRNPVPATRVCLRAGRHQQADGRPRRQRAGQPVAGRRHLATGYRSL